jgi:hypothetical protein
MVLWISTKIGRFEIGGELASFILLLESMGGDLMSASNQPYPSDKGVARKFISILTYSIQYL